MGLLGTSDRSLGEGVCYKSEKLEDEKVFVACVSSLFILMFHPALLFFHTHFDITFLSIFLPNFPVLKAQDIEMFGFLAKSDANTGYEPKQFDKITFVDNDTMLNDDADAITLDCSVFPQCLKPLFRTFIMVTLLFK